MNNKNRRRHLESLRGEERTMIFYEAPHKLPATLADLAETFGPDRPVSLCRELTKLHEEIIRTTLGEAAERYQTEPRRSPWRTAWTGSGHSGRRRGCPCGTR